MGNNRYTAIMWSWVDGRWHRINAARPAQDAKDDTRGKITSKPEVTNDQIYADLEKRRAFAIQYGSNAIYTVTSDGRVPQPPE